MQAEGGSTILSGSEPDEHMIEEDDENEDSNYEDAASSSSDDSDDSSVKYQATKKSTKAKKRKTYSSDEDSNSSANSDDEDEAYFWRAVEPEENEVSLDNCQIDAVLARRYPTLSCNRFIPKIQFEQAPQQPADDQQQLFYEPYIVCTADESDDSAPQLSTNEANNATNKLSPPIIYATPFYYVKFKHYSLWHAKWLTQEQLASISPARVKNFEDKYPEKQDVYLFNGANFKVEQLLDYAPK